MRTAVVRILQADELEIAFRGVAQLARRACLSSPARTSRSAARRATAAARHAGTPCRDRSRSPCTSRPSTMTRPPVAVSSPIAMRSAVVLPQPRGPISATISPSWTVKLTRFSACTYAPRHRRASVKRFDTSRKLTSPIRDFQTSILYLVERQRRSGSVPAAAFQRLAPSRLARVIAALRPQASTF